MVTLASISPVHKFDEKRLSNYLSRQGLEDFNSPMLAQQFQGGQSNPTFCLEANNKRYVLRKKPPGKLLPSAHLIEREYKIMSALAETDVPVPVMRHLCEDEKIIGLSLIHI